MDNTNQLIVVVEDDAGMSRALRRLLDASGFRTVMFESAEALMRANGASAASCLVIDVQLPGLSGPLLYEQLGVGRPPVVFITAHDSPATRHAVALSGGTEFLTKPFIRKDLLNAISRATQQGPSP